MVTHSTIANKSENLTALCGLPMTSYMLGTLVENAVTHTFICCCSYHLAHAYKSQRSRVEKDF